MAHIPVRRVASPYRHTLARTLDATGTLHELASSLGTERMPVPTTVTEREVQMVRYAAAGLLLALQPINGCTEAALPKLAA